MPTQEEIQEILSHFKTREFYGVEAFVEGANEFVSRFNSKHRKDPMEKLNVRTLRYYLADQSGPLLISPKKKMAQLLVFGYPEFVRLIAVRWFQAQSLHLSVIKAALKEMTTEQLERAIGEPIKVFADRAEMNSFISASGEKLDDNFVELRDSEAMRDFLEDRKRSEGQVIQRASDGVWKRVTLAPGLELNIAKQFARPRNKSEREELLRKIETAIDDADKE